jgi:beta-glucosidase
MTRHRLWISLFLAAVPHGPLHAAGHFWDEIPPSPSTTRPAEVLDDYWNSEFQRVNREIAATKDPGLLFFGDSLTWSWSLGPATGKAVWEKQFVPHRPINMGNSGDITPVMLHRVTRGNLDFPAGVHPKVAVLLCGINNFGVTTSARGKETWDLGKDCPLEDIAHGQRAIAQVFRRKLPHTRVIMIALLPVADRVKWEKCQRVNAIQNAVTSDSKEVAFINLQDRFLLADGTIDKSMFTDGLHLSAGGYQAMADALAPTIQGFLKAPPLDPAKILLIGGSLTEGVDSSRCYRRHLDGMLRRKGHLIDFIGSRHRHHDDKSEADSYEFDPDHEGHWGKGPAWFADNMARLLVGNAPDVAVIEMDAAGDLVQHLKRVVASLRASNPKVGIVLANTGPAEVRKERSALIEGKIASAGASSVTVVEIDRAAASKDGLPGVEEARKMAASLAGVMEPLLRQ